MEREVHYWTGRATSKDPAGWYINWRDEWGNIFDVGGPFATRELAEDEEWETREP